MIQLAHVPKTKMKKIKNSKTSTFHGVVYRYVNKYKDGVKNYVWKAFFVELSTI